MLIGNRYGQAEVTSITVSPAETVKVPQMAESISEGTLKTWLKQPGESVEADEEVATIETDKVRVLNVFFILFSARRVTRRVTSAILCAPCLHLLIFDYLLFRGPRNSRFHPR